MRQLERQVLLTVLDRKWREHLYEMDYLREGIGLRAMAQKDPLVEYQREGAQMFQAMMDAFMEEVVTFLFNLEVNVAPAPAVGVQTDAAGNVLNAKTLGVEAEAHQARHVLTGPDETGHAAQTVEEPSEEPEPQPAASDLEATADATVAAARRAQAQRSNRPKKRRR